MAEKMKGQFFLIATVILIGSILTLTLALRPVERRQWPSLSAERSLLKEMELASINNISPMSLMDFARGNGIRSVAAVSGGGKIVVYNGYGGNATAMFRQGNSAETYSTFQDNTTFSSTANSTISVWVGGRLVSFHLDGNKQGIAAAVFVEREGMEGLLESIYIAR